MKPFSRVVRALLSASMCSLASCGAKQQDSIGGAIGTGSPRDAGPRSDAGKVAVLPDAGNFDVKIYSGDRYLCGYDTQDLLGFDGSSTLEEIASATDERGFALLHHDQAGGLWIEGVPIDGQAQAPVALLNASEQATGVAIVANGVHFLLAWQVPGDAARRLRVRELSTPDQAVTELTDQLALGTGGGQLSALAAVGDGFVVAFAETSGASPELRLQRFSADGQRMSEPLTVAGIGARAPEDIHLAPLDSGGALLAWLERDASSQGHIMGLPLSSSLSKSGESSELSKNAVFDAPFDLAGRRQSEGLIYHAKDGDVRDAIKYRRVDPSGVATQAVLNLVNAPGRVRDGSIAAFGQGYAVAYRELPSLGVDHPTVHIAFVNQFGAVVHQAELSDTTEGGGRTTVAATADGHLLVGWTTELPSGASTNALKLYCPGALVLCGGTAK
jgi:hypothetical protein